MVFRRIHTQSILDISNERMSARGHHRCRWSIAKLIEDDDINFTNGAQYPRYMSNDFPVILTGLIDLYI